MAALCVGSPAYAAPGDPTEQSQPSGESGSAAASATQSPEPAAPAVACESPAQPSPVYPKVPWTVSNYDPAERIWPYSTGSGVTVAVVSTGVSPAQSQLDGHVLTGHDFVRGTNTGMDDCVGQGTAISSVIAAQPTNASGFVGLAPNTEILPVRVSEHDQVVSKTDEPVPPATVAAGIDWAAAQGAEVIVVGVVVFVDDPKLATSVKAAQAAGAVIVAPVGDDHPKDEPAALAPTPDALTPYPAAYDAVIGVGAVSSSGARLPASEVGPYVDVVAPGDGVLAGAPGGGHQEYTGTAIASSFAGAAAALLIGQPGQPWAQGAGVERSIVIEHRLRSTASPVSGHFAELGYGAGVVDPARALTDLTSEEAAVSASPYTPPVRTDEEIAHQRFEAQGESRALALTWGALGGLIAALLGYVVLRRVRRNKGIALSTPQITETERDQELQYVPGEQLFAPPAEPK